MSQKPADLFLGIFDIFSILLPGAFLMFIFANDVGPLSGLVPQLQDTLERLIALLIVSYLLGHILFHLASFLDGFYDGVYVVWKRESKSKSKHNKDKTIWGFILSFSEFLQMVAQWLLSLFGINSQSQATRRKEAKNNDRLFKRALHLKKKMLKEIETGEDEASPITKIWSWAGSYVRVNSAAATSEIDRAAADSKFFRSLTLVFFASFVKFAFLQPAEAPWIVSILLMAFSFWRFLTLRWKSTVLTYEYFILLDIMKSDEAKKEDAGTD